MEYNTILSSATSKLLPDTDILVDAEKTPPDSFENVNLIGPHDPDAVGLVGPSISFLAKKLGLPVTSFETISTQLVNPEDLHVDSDGSVTCLVWGIERDPANWKEYITPPLPPEPLRDL